MCKIATQLSGFGFILCTTYRHLMCYIASTVKRVQKNNTAKSEGTVFMAPLYKCWTFLCREHFTLNTL